MAGRSEVRQDGVDDSRGGWREGGTKGREVGIEGEGVSKVTRLRNAELSWNRGALPDQNIMRPL